MLEVLNLFGLLKKYTSLLNIHFPTTKLKSAQEVNPKYCALVPEAPVWCG